MRRFALLASVALVSGFAFSAQAAPEKFELDKPHTQIIFSVNHLGFSTSYGKFTDYAGTINLDQQEPKNSDVDVTIQTASLDMSDEKWDEHLKSKDFFDVEQFPTMTFKSTKVEVTGDKTANVTGDLTLHGVTKPVTLAVTYNGTGKHPMMDRMETGFEATGKIKRSDFGMGYGVPAVGDDVNITISVEAFQPPKAGQGLENQ
jgi:polyisoprenoid-binding protein YceI